jgi:hypothetical protein
VFLDLSHSHVSGPWPYFSSAFGTLRELYLQNTSLHGQLAAEPFHALQCFRAAPNMGLCGPQPPDSACFNTSGTRIGEVAPLDSAAFGRLQQYPGNSLAAITRLLWQAAATERMHQ